MSKFYIIISLLFISFISQGQVTKFSEIFDEANGSISGVSAEGIPWAATHVGGGNVPNVSGGVFRNNNSDGVSTWLSNNIDISQCKKLVFSMNYNSSLAWAGSGNMEHCAEAAGCGCDPYNASTGACANNWDFIYLELIVDGTVIHTDIVGLDASSPQTYTFTYSGPCFNPGDYDYAQIKVMTQTWAGDEVISFDNVNLGCYENLDVSITNIGPLCENAAPVTLSGTPPGGIFSGAGVSGNQFNPGVAGPGIHEITYTVTQGGCPSQASIFVQVNPELTPTFNIEDEYCVGETPAILPNTSGNGIAGTWNPTTISTATSGNQTYTFTPNAGVCAEPYSFVVSVLNGPTITLSADPVPLCEGDNLTLHAAGGVSYQWSGPNSFTSTSPDPVINNVTQANAGTYTVTVTGANGCPNTATITITIDVCGCINPPVANAGPDGSVCEGEQIILSGTVNTTATWTTLGDGIFSNPNTAITSYTPGANDIINGTVTFTLTANDPDGPGPCLAASDKVIYIINDAPGGSINGSISLCPDACDDVQVSLTGGSNSYDVNITASGNGLNFTFTMDNINGNNALNICYSGNVPSYNNATNTLNIPLSIPAGTIIFTINSIEDAITGCEGIITGSVQVALLANPVIVISPVGNMCINAGIVNLSATPAGGTFSGPGVSGNTFNPQIAGAGNHQITYALTQNGCDATESISITVHPLPVVTINPISDLCSDDAAVNLVGNPAGGTWSGVGINGNSFDPNVAGPGTHMVSYNFTDANGCAGTATQQVTVTDCGCPNPAVADAGIDQNLCDGNAVVLSGSVSSSATWTTSGSGTFTDPNNANTSYTPSAADILAGSVTLSLTANDPDGAGPCSSASDQLVVNFNILEIFINPVPAICIDNGIIVLNATLAGGTWSGTGVIGNQFDPSISGSGNHTLTYSVTQNNCTASQNIQITVNELPVVSIFPVDDLCSSDAAVNLIVSPPGGTLSGSGINGNNFDPSFAGPGNHSITYDFTDGNGCSATTSISITVEDCDCANPATADAGPDQAVCGNGAVQLSGTVNTTAGWTTSGSGIFNNANIANPTYTPSAADITAGSVTLTLTASDPDGAGPCSAKTDILVVTFTSLSVTIDPVPDLCIDGDAVTLVAQPTSGSWSGSGISGTLFDPSQAGVGSHILEYTVTQNGCTASSEITISVNPLPVVTLSPIADLCKDDAVIQLTNGSPTGGEYFINGDLNSPVTSFDPNAVGVFSLTYIFTDGNGCSNSAEIDFNVLDCDCAVVVTTDAGPDQEICGGQTVALNGVVTGVAGGVWTTSGDGSFSNANLLNATFNPGPNDILSGSVVLTLTSDDPDGAGPCSVVSNSMTIKINAAPVINFPQINELCLDAAPVVMAATPTGGVFSGSGVNGNTFDPAIAGIGEHTIYYTAGISTCTSIDSMVISVKDCACSIVVSVNAGSDQMICSGADINLNAIISGVTSGKWTTSGSGIFSNPDILNPEYTPSIIDISAGKVTLTFTTQDPDGAGPCLAKSDQMEVTIIRVPDVTLLIKQPDCTNSEGSIKVSFPSGNNLLFSTDNGQTYSAGTDVGGLDPASYTLYVKTVSNNCVEMVDFEINDVVYPVIQWKPTFAACTNSANALSIQNGQNLSFPVQVKVNGASREVINSLPFNFQGITTGSYIVELTDAKGCVVLDTFDFDKGSSINVTAPDFFEIKKGESVTITPEITGTLQNITWTPSTFLDCDDCEEVISTPEENNMTYTVRVTDENGCTDETEITIRFVKDLLDVFIPNVFSPNNDGVNDYFTVYVDENVTSIRTLKIFNRWGAPVFERSDFAPNKEELGWDGTYRGQALVPDVFVYYVEVEIDGQIRLFKGDVTIVR